MSSRTDDHRRTPLACPPCAARAPGYLMMILSTRRHPTVHELGCTESRRWCLPVPVTSPERTQTLPILSEMSASHTFPLHRRALTGGGSARVTILFSRSDVIQS